MDLEITQGWKEYTMTQLELLIAKARDTTMSDADREAQRQSFAYGNAHFENERITRETIRRASEDLRNSHNAAEQQPSP